MAALSSGAIRKSLEAKRQKLTLALGVRDGLRRGGEPGELDSITPAIERQIASVDTDRRSTVVREIEDAVVPVDIDRLHCQEARELDRRSVGLGTTL